MSVNYNDELKRLWGPMLPPPMDLLTHMSRAVWIQSSLCLYPTSNNTPKEAANPVLRGSRFIKSDSSTQMCSSLRSLRFGEGWKKGRMDGDGNHGEANWRGQGKMLSGKGQRAAQGTEVTVRHAQTFLRADVASIENSIPGWNKEKRGVGGK